MSATQFMNASGCDDSESYSEALRRLNALEEELGEACRNGGASGSNGAPPPDPQLTELVAHAISSGLPHADVQIVVSSLRKTTTTKQCYETETPGMCGLDPDRLRELQQQLMAKISLPSFDVKSTNNNTAPDNQHHTNGHSTTNGVGRDSASDATIQHKSTVEEGFANDDGTQVTSKKLTRIVTTSHSGVSGVDNFGKNDEHAVAQPQQQYGGSESGACAPPSEEDAQSIASSLGSVRDRIAIFESLKESTPTSVAAATQPDVAPSLQSVKLRASLYSQQMRATGQEGGEKAPSPDASSTANEHGQPEAEETTVLEKAERDAREVHGGKPFEVEGTVAWPQQPQLVEIKNMESTTVTTVTSDGYGKEPITVVESTTHIPSLQGVEEPLVPTVTTTAGVAQSSPGGEGAYYAIINDDAAPSTDRSTVASEPRVEVAPEDELPVAQPVVGEAMVTSAVKYAELRHQQPDVEKHSEERRSNADVDEYVAVEENPEDWHAQPIVVPDESVTVARQESMAKNTVTEGQPSAESDRPFPEERLPKDKPDFVKNFHPDSTANTEYSQEESEVHEQIEPATTVVHQMTTPTTIVEQKQLRTEKISSSSEHFPEEMFKSSGDDAHRPESEPQISDTETACEALMPQPELQPKMIEEFVVYTDLNDNITHEKPSVNDDNNAKLDEKEQVRTPVIPHLIVEEEASPASLSDEEEEAVKSERAYEPPLSRYEMKKRAAAATASAAAVAVEVRGMEAASSKQGTTERQIPLMEEGLSDSRSAQKYSISEAITHEAEESEVLEAVEHYWPEDESQMTVQHASHGGMPEPEESVLATTTTAKEMTGQSDAGIDYGDKDEEPEDIVVCREQITRYDSFVEEQLKQPVDEQLTEEYFPTHQQQTMVADESLLLQRDEEHPVVDEMPREPESPEKFVDKSLVDPYAEEFDLLAEAKQIDDEEYKEPTDLREHYAHTDEEHYSEEDEIHRPEVKSVDQESETKEEEAYGHTIVKSSEVQSPKEVHHDDLKYEANGDELKEEKHTEEQYDVRIETDHSKAEKLYSSEEVFDQETEKFPASAEKRASSVHHSLDEDDFHREEVYFPKDLDRAKIIDRQEELNAQRTEKVAHFIVEEEPEPPGRVLHTESDNSVEYAPPEPEPAAYAVVEESESATASARRGSSEDVMITSVYDAKRLDDVMTTSVYAPDEEEKRENLERYLPEADYSIAVDEALVTSESYEPIGGDVAFARIPSSPPKATAAASMSLDDTEEEGVKRAIPSNVQPMKSRVDDKDEAARAEEPETKSAHDVYHASIVEEITSFRGPPPAEDKARPVDSPPPPPHSVSVDSALVESKSYDAIAANVNTVLSPRVDSQRPHSDRVEEAETGLLDEDKREEEAAENEKLFVSEEPTVKSNVEKLKSEEFQVEEQPTEATGLELPDDKVEENEVEARHLEQMIRDEFNTVTHARPHPEEEWREELEERQYTLGEYAMGAAAAAIGAAAAHLRHRRASATPPPTPEVGERPPQFVAGGDKPVSSKAASEVGSPKFINKEGFKISYVQQETKSELSERKMEEESVPKMVTSNDDEKPKDRSEHMTSEIGGGPEQSEAIIDDYCNESMEYDRPELVREEFAQKPNHHNVEEDFRKAEYESREAQHSPENASREYVETSGRTHPEDPDERVSLEQKVEHEIFGRLLGELDREFGGKHGRPFPESSTELSAVQNPENENIVAVMSKTRQYSPVEDSRESLQMTAENSAADQKPQFAEHNLDATTTTTTTMMMTASSTSGSLPTVAAMERDESNYSQKSAGDVSCESFETETSSQATVIAAGSTLSAPPPEDEADEEDRTLAEQSVDPEEQLAFYRPDPIVGQHTEESKSDEARPEVIKDEDDEEEDGYEFVGPDDVLPARENSGNEDDGGSGSAQKPQEIEAEVERVIEELPSYELPPPEAKSKPLGIEPEGERIIEKSSSNEFPPLEAENESVNIEPEGERVIEFSSEDENDEAKPKAFLARDISVGIVESSSLQFSNAAETDFDAVARPYHNAEAEVEEAADGDDETIPMDPQVTTVYKDIQPMSEDNDDETARRQQPADAMTQSVYFGSGTAAEDAFDAPPEEPQIEQYEMFTDSELRDSRQDVRKPDETHGEENSEEPKIKPEEAKMETEASGEGNDFYLVGDEDLSQGEGATEMSASVIEWKATDLVRDVIDGLSVEEVIGRPEVGSEEANTEETIANASQVVEMSRVHPEVGAEAPNFEVEESPLHLKTDTKYYHEEAKNSYPSEDEAHVRVDLKDKTEFETKPEEYKIEPEDNPEAEMTERQSKTEEESPAEDQWTMGAHGHAAAVEAEAQRRRHQFVPIYSQASIITQLSEEEIPPPSVDNPIASYAADDDEEEEGLEEELELLGRKQPQQEIAASSSFGMLSVDDGATEKFRRPKSPIPPPAVATLRQQQRGDANGTPTQQMVRPESTDEDERKVRHTSDLLKYEVDDDSVFMDSPLPHVDRIIDSPDVAETETIKAEAVGSLAPHTEAATVPLEDYIDEIITEIPADMRLTERTMEDSFYVGNDAEEEDEADHPPDSARDLLDATAAGASAPDNFSSEGSLQEFERIEQELRTQHNRRGSHHEASEMERKMVEAYLMGFAEDMDQRKTESEAEESSPEAIVRHRSNTTVISSASATADQLLAQHASGSISSLTEFENLEREIRNAMLANANGAGAVNNNNILTDDAEDEDDEEEVEEAAAAVVAAVDDVMVLSDIREESEDTDEALGGGHGGPVQPAVSTVAEEDERMSTREDDEVDEELDEPDSLAEEVASGCQRQTVEDDVDSLAEAEEVWGDRKMEATMDVSGVAQGLGRSDVQDRTVKDQVEVYQYHHTDQEERHLECLTEDAATAATTMITSVDSLELERQYAEAAAAADPRLLMETSADSLEPSYGGHPSLEMDMDRDSLKQDDDDDDRLKVEETRRDDDHHSTVADDGRSAMTNEGSGEGGMAAEPPTTQTTFETTRLAEDGVTLETITRRVTTRVNDPIHSRIRFTGAEDERRLRERFQQRSASDAVATADADQEEQPLVSVDDEGNVTTIVCHRTSAIH